MTTAVARALLVSDASSVAPSTLAMTPKNTVPVEVFDGTGTRTVFVWVTPAFSAGTSTEPRAVSPIVMLLSEDRKTPRREWAIGVVPAFFTEYFRLIWAPAAVFVGPVSAVTTRSPGGCSGLKP